VLFKLGVSAGAALSASEAPSLFATARAMLLQPSIWGGLALYGLGTVLWLGALAQTELSQAYPFVALGFVLTAVLGYLIFGDSIGPMRVLGIGLVILGVCVVARS
jgi:multidrug transporter EmrE-like cation transporter